MKKKKVPVVEGTLNTSTVLHSGSQDTSADSNFQKHSSTYRAPPIPGEPPSLPSKEPNYPLFVAKYGYSSRTDDDLGFEKGDLLYIIDAEEADWWFARSKQTYQEGYIPSNFVAEYGSLDAEE